MQEEDLLSRDIENWNGLLAGNRKAFENLYSDYFKILYNYGRKICTDVTQVEDAIHDLFVDLWRFKSNLSKTTSVRFYLYRSLRRRIINTNTKADFRFEQGLFLEDSLRLTSPSLEHQIIENEVNTHQHIQLKKLLNDLSPRQYEALVLYYYDEFSYAEIATMLEVNEQSARNLVQRGLAQLRQFAKIIVSLYPFLIALFSQA